MGINHFRAHNIKCFVNHIIYKPNATDKLLSDKLACNFWSLNPSTLDINDGLITTVYRLHLSGDMSYMIDTKNI